MKRSTFIRGNSRVIFSVDVSGIDALRDMADVNKYIQSIIEKMPKRSMLLLLDVRNMSATDDIVESIRTMSVNYGSYFKSSAVVADGSNEGKMRELVGKTGLKKMNIYLSMDAAKKKLLGEEYGGDESGKY
jgi:hypothetical protein